MALILNRREADITLGYWGIRGLGQPIRFLLVAAQVPFSEVRLGVFDDGRLMNEAQEDEDWAQVRASLDMPFPNLPYLIDTSALPPVQLSQSNAILRYLARRFDFYGDSEEERSRIDVLQDEAYDFRNEIIETAYTLGDAYEEKIARFKTDILAYYLDGFERYLKTREQRQYFVGSRLSLVDFVLYELLWQMTVMVPGCISETNRPALFAFIRAFEAQPSIADYLRSAEFIERPINSPWASFA